VKRSGGARQRFAKRSEEEGNDKSEDESVRKNEIN